LNFIEIIEQEEDKAVQKFEENNEINFKLNEKVEKSINIQNVRFFGIANEQTKFLGKTEFLKNG